GRLCRRTRDLRATRSCATILFDQCEGGSVFVEGNVAEFFAGRESYARHLFTGVCFPDLCDRLFIAAGNEEFAVCAEQSAPFKPAGLWGVREFIRENQTALTPASFKFPPASRKTPADRQRFAVSGKSDVVNRHRCSAQ